MYQKSIYDFIAINFTLALYLAVLPQPLLICLSVFLTCNIMDVAAVIVDGVSCKLIALFGINKVV